MHNPIFSVMPRVRERISDQGRGILDAKEPEFARLFSEQRYSNLFLGH